MLIVSEKFGLLKNLFINLISNAINQALNQLDIVNLFIYPLIEVNDVKDPNALVPQQLKVETRDGRFYAKSTSEVYGSPSAPMSEDEQFQKFSGCLDFSGIQGMNDRRSQWEKWFDFHKLDSVHELITEFSIT